MASMDLAISALDPSSVVNSLTADCRVVPYS